MSYYFSDDIIANIVKFADVPIDTRLAFQQYGVTPRKLVVPEEISLKLCNIFRRRLSYFDRYNRDMELMKNSLGMYKVCYPKLECAISGDNASVYIDIIDMEGECCYWVMKYGLLGWGPYSIHNGSILNK